MQRRSPKVIPSIKHLSYKERLKKIGIPTLENRRKRGDAIQFYKFIKNFNQANWHHVNAITDSINCNGPARSICGSTHRLRRQLIKNCPRDYFFSNRVVPVWNVVPEEVVQANTINTFKVEFNENFIQKNNQNK